MLKTQKSQDVDYLDQLRKPADSDKNGFVYEVDEGAGVVRILRGKNGEQVHVLPRSHLPDAKEGQTVRLSPSVLRILGASTKTDPNEKMEPDEAEPKGKKR
jgi:hypothetical protein